jgi:hypothetical protein
VKQSFKDTWFEFLRNWLNPANTTDESTKYEWSDLRREITHFGSRRGIRTFTRFYRGNRYIKAAAEDFWLRRSRIQGGNR